MSDSALKNKDLGIESGQMILQGVEASLTADYTLNTQKIKDAKLS